jgi:Zn-dependent peptidase ImmA (M78 family)
MAKLKKIFSLIRYFTDQILGEENNTCFSEKPFVDIETLAKNVGITEIKPVPPEEINYEHARLRGTVILVNDNDSPEEKRFSVAHEVYHFICTEKEAARSVANPKLDIWENHYENADEEIFMKLAQATSKEYGKVVSGYIGKPISEKTEKIVYEKIGKAVFEIMGRNVAKINGKTISKKTTLSFYKEIKKAFDDVITETVEEEIADYFAANLLVPTERFILWEEKTDEEIARAFGVTMECIRKRRKEEIENELYFLTPENLSSDVKMEDHAPLSVNEMDKILEGYCLHDNRGV